MIKFQTLKIDGFAGQDTHVAFKLNNPGLNLITGPNGIGKSRLFNALSWGLYGKTLKNKASVETWEHLQPDDYQGAMVGVSFHLDGHKFKVIRGANYKGQVNGAPLKSRLILERDGEPFPKNIKDKRDIQRAVTEVLGMSYELFTNTVVFPQRVTRFIEESGATKKKILEESFKLAWVSQALAFAKEEAKDLELTHKDLSAEAKEFASIIQEIDQSLTSMEEAKEEWEEEHSEDIITIKEDIEKLEEVSGKQISSYEALKEEINHRENRITTLENDPLVTTYDETNRRLRKLIPQRDNATRLKGTAEKALETLRKTNSCPECGQVIPKKDLNEHKRNHRKVVGDQTNKLKLLEEEIKPLKEDILNGDDVKKELNKLRLELRPKRQQWDDSEKERLKVEGAKGRIKELNKQLETEEAKIFKDLSPPFRRRKFEVEKKLVKKEKEIKKIQRKLDTIMWCIKVPLSNSGIKSYMFNTLLDTLNNRIEYYERFTGLGVWLEIDMVSVRKDIHTIIEKEGGPVAYDDLSGGESQLINVVMAMSQSDILTLENPTNLYVMDEVFEGMDPENIEIVGSLLRDKAKDKSLFVITHNDQFNPQNANLIRMEHAE